MDWYFSDIIIDPKIGNFSQVSNQLLLPYICGKAVIFLYTNIRYSRQKIMFQFKKKKTLTLPTPRFNSLGDSTSLLKYNFIISVSMHKHIYIYIYIYIYINTHTRTHEDLICLEHLAKHSRDYLRQSFVWLVRNVLSANRNNYRLLKKSAIHYRTHETTILVRISIQMDPARIVKPVSVSHILISSCLVR
jgi:hypothetical protein